MKTFMLFLALLVTATWSLDSHAAKANCLAAKFKLRSQIDEIISESSGPLSTAIKKLHPGQYIVGEARALHLIDEVRQMEFWELKDMLEEKPIPYVKGPTNTRWMVDRHHMLYTLNRLYSELADKGIAVHKLKVHYEMVEDYSHMSQSKFLETMEKRGFIYPYPLNGRRDLNNIPSHIGDLQYEYYRGLAWILEEVGAIKKKSIPFFEFYWGQYLERKLGLESERYTKANIKKAIRLVTKQEGEHTKFPGHVKDPYEVDDYMDDVDDILEVINKMKAKGY